MQAFKDGELVEVTTEEFVQSLYRHANWAEEEFKVRSDPASSLGMLMTQAANELDRMRAERLKLDRRIHNQRVMLRTNWEILEMRANYKRMPQEVRSRMLRSWCQASRELSRLRKTSILRDAGLAGFGAFLCIVVLSWMR